MIAAVSVGNFAIGYEGKLCYSIRDDLKRFKELTYGHSVIMGRKTWESLPKKPLMGRKNIVITSSELDDKPEDVIVVNSLGSALSICKDEDLVFIIGGGSVYKEAYPLADELFLTEIFATPERSDTFFPPYHGDFKCVEREYRVDYGLRYEFTKYVRTDV